MAEHRAPRRSEQRTRKAAASRRRATPAAERSSRAGDRRSPPAGEAEETQLAATEHEAPDPGVGLLGLGPAVARMTLSASARAALWSAGVGLSTTRRGVQALRQGESLPDVLSGVQRDAVRSARALLGIDALEAMLDERGDSPSSTAGTRRAAGGRQAAREDPPREGPPSPPHDQSTAHDPESLRTQARKLLRRSAEIRAEPDLHPAFAAVLGQLAPDEARILRLLAVRGPQPVVDVSAAGPLGIGRREVAQTLSMIGTQAGCLHEELVPLYLDNLERLGLVRRGGDPLEDDSAYEVLQAQPEVASAEERASSGPTRPRVEKGSLELTAFGWRFCRVCMPRDDD